MPRHWIGAGPRFKVTEARRGQAAAQAAGARPASTRATVFIGPPTMSGYTIEADLLATRQGRRMPDLGLINQGYTLDLMGNHQKLQLRVVGLGAREVGERSLPVASPTSGTT